MSKEVEGQYKAFYGTKELNHVTYQRDTTTDGVEVSERFTGTVDDILELIKGLDEPEELKADSIDADLIGVDPLTGQFIPKSKE